MSMTRKKNSGTSKEKQRKCEDELHDGGKPRGRVACATVRVIQIPNGRYGEIGRGDKHDKVVLEFAHIYLKDTF